MEVTVTAEEDQAPPGSNPALAQSTYFASAARASAEVLADDIQRLTGHPVSEAILAGFGGIVLILNAQRQIVAANRTLLDKIGIADPGTALGYRPGEVLRCSHSVDAPGGCGTNKACRDCGFAIAAVTCPTAGQSVERECLMTRMVDGVEEACEFRVRATPLALQGRAFTAVTLQDIRLEKRHDILQRVFLHDLGNLVGAVASLAELASAANAPDRESVLADLQEASQRLVDGVVTERDLIQMEAGEYVASRSTVPIRQVWASVLQTIRHHKAATGRRLEPPTMHDDIITTDRVLLARVLINMVTNALEGTAPGGVVRLWHQLDPSLVTFCVHNEATIPERVALRVFQRSFTTKAGVGRGNGAYSMKLIGERYLGGTVSFETGPEGTTFQIQLPRSDP